MKKRDETIDIIKGIGILCVVIGHAHAPFSSFIYLFHMAIFLWHQDIVIIQKIPKQ